MRELVFPFILATALICLQLVGFSPYRALVWGFPVSVRQ